MTPRAYPTSFLQPVHASGFKINNPLWSQRLKYTIVNWIPHCCEQLSNPALPEGGIDNFVQASLKLSGKPAKDHVGYWFSNAYVLNTVEAICNALMLDPQGDAKLLAAQQKLRAVLDDWLPKILAAQEPDGYLQTWTTLKGKEHWSDRLAHEGYVAGYFLEAAISHYRMTGLTDPSFYHAAKRLADCWYDHIGPAPKKSWWDGHQEMEQALTRFARFVDEVEGAHQGDKYVQLAKFLLDERQGGDEYDQSHTLPIHQTEAVGHSVRAVYMYAAMADVALLTGDPDYAQASHALWDNLVNRKMYLTGGVGSGESAEGFGADYSLPNAAYCESCANCGMLFFQHKLNLTDQDARYADLMELVLYNGILGSLDLEGRNFTYTNPLDQDFARYKWHACPCCVGNIPRTLLALPTWMYAKSSDALYINLYVGSTVTLDDVAGTRLEVVQTTDYPWAGKVTITINPSSAKEFTIKLRVPNRNVSDCYTSQPEVNGLTALVLNGVRLTPKINKGYTEITRTWQPGDQIEITLPLEVQRVKARQEVAADKDRTALQYGPLVYNFESVDHKVDVTRLIISPEVTFAAQWQDNLLGGVVVLKGTTPDGSILTAIPNYARNNRGGRSIVWLREKELPPPPEFVAWYKFDEGSGNLASDSTGNGHAAQLNGGAYWAAGKSGSAAHFDGKAGYVSLPAGIVENVDDFTIAAWVRLEANSIWSRLFDFGSGPEANMFLTPVSGSKTLRFAITTGGGSSEQQINSNKTLYTGEWRHVAVTLAGNVGILYVDGNEVARNETMTLKPSSLGPTTHNYIGKSQYDDPYLKGLVDDFRIYSRALSADEIRTLAAG